MENIEEKYFDTSNSQLSTIREVYERVDFAELSKMYIYGKTAEKKSKNYMQCRGERNMQFIKCRNVEIGACEDPKS